MEGWSNDRLGERFILHRDHIAEAYLGKWGDAFTQAKSRRRIDWLVENAIGPKVLDIGCSGGILPILLGREGFEVVGIDINHDAITFANSLLEKEEPAVRNRVNFLCGDLFGDHLGGETFDCVILGQVLEHFSDPEPVLGRALQFLRKQGTLLVTTPYGYLPHEDHRTVFSLEDFLALFRDLVTPRELDVVDGNIRFRASREKPIEKDWNKYSGDSIAQLLERNALQEQMRLYERIQTLKEKLESANLKYRGLGDDFKTQKSRIESLQKDLDAARKERKHLQTSLEKACEDYDKLEEDHRRTEKILSKLELTLDEVQGKYETTRDERRNLEARLGQLSNEIETMRIKLQNMEAERNNILDYYDDFQQSTVYRSVIAIRRALYEPGLNTLRLPFTLLGHAIQKIKRDRRRKESEQAISGLTDREDFYPGGWKRIPIDLSQWVSESSKLRFVDDRILVSDFPKDGFGYIRLNSSELLPKFTHGESYRLILQGRNPSGPETQLFVVEITKTGRRVESASINTPIYYQPGIEDPPDIRIRLKGAGRVEFDSILVLPGEREAPPEISKTIDCLDDVKVACIFDPFTMACFQPECKLIKPTPGNWVDLFEEERPDVLIVESAWEGNGGVWNRKVAQYPNCNSELYAMIRYCRERGIPSLFWNKEDPVHFKSFIGTARWFDYIFTTDADCIERYKKITGNPNVYALPFAAQPAIHNPIEIFDERSEKIVFAGAYYAIKYPERKKDLDRLTEVCKDFGLDIYDRNYGKAIDEFEYPDHLKEFIVGGLPIEEIYKAYKGYKFAINVNSVKHSPTMLSRRVFELVASNTPIVSSYSEATEHLFGDLVICSDDVSVLREKLEALYSSKQAYDLFRLLGLRHVHSRHTYEKRLRFMLELAGFKVNRAELGVTCIVNVKSTSEYRKARKQLERTSPDCKQIVVLHPNIALEDEDITEINLAKMRSAEIQEHISEGWVCVIDPDAYYGANYLQDLLLASRYCGSRVIGKGAYYRLSGNGLVLEREGDEYRYTRRIPLGRSMFKSELLKNERVSKAILGRGYKFDMGQILEEEESAFSIDRFNYIDNRDGVLDKNVVGMVDDRESDLLPNLLDLYHQEITESLDTSFGISTKHDTFFQNTSGRYLVVTNIYPRQGDLYRNAFVHRRIKLYEDYGVQCDVFVLDKSLKNLIAYQFDGVNVFKGNEKQYRWLLSTSNYEKYLIHFVSPEMINGLDACKPKMSIIVWIHAIEAESWHRRLFNYSLWDAKGLFNRFISSRRQLRFLRALYENSEERDIEFVFVSRWFKDNVAEPDAGTRVQNAHIIHNPIDTELFRYRSKKPEQRKKILSIRPYSSRVYANDLSVKTVLRLSKNEFFHDLEFMFVGEGNLFHSTLKPIEGFGNVRIIRSFLKQEEIAALHKQFGIFLCPTRWDSQGVSRGEAMASGLVPTTNSVAAVTEFIDRSCGILADQEDHVGLAAGIERLYWNPEMFLELSRSAAKRVLQQCGPEQTIEKELALIRKGIAVSHYGPTRS